MSISNNYKLQNTNKIIKARYIYYLNTLSPPSSFTLVMSDRWYYRTCRWSKVCEPLLGKHNLQILFFAEGQLLLRIVRLFERLWLILWWIISVHANGRRLTWWEPNPPANFREVDIQSTSSKTLNKNPPNPWFSILIFWTSVEKSKFLQVTKRKNDLYWPQ